MTYVHGGIIVLSLAAVVVCGYHHECGAQINQVSDIAKMIIAGVLGNAMGRAKREPT